MPLSSPLRLPLRLGLTALAARRGGEAALVYPLDLISGDAPAFAYSTIRLSEGYTGPALRVIRASDAAESDIGFSGQFLDVEAWNAFAGASTCSVLQFYDQSGRANHSQQQTTLANRFLLHPSRVNGVPMLYSNTGALYALPEISFSTRSRSDFAVQIAKTGLHGLFEIGPASSSWVFHTNLNHHSSSPVIWVPRSPTIVENILSASSRVQRILDADQAAVLPADATSSGGFVGVQTSGYTFKGMASAFISYDRVLMSEDRDLLRSSLAAFHNVGLIKSGRVIFVGDSISVGANATNDYGFSARAANYLPNTLRLHPAAGGGNQLQTEVSSYASRQTKTYMTAFASDRRIVFLHMGTNDITVGNRTAPQLSSDIEAFCSLVKADGAEVVVSTILPANSWSLNATRKAVQQDVNNFIRVNWASFADGFVDLEADPLIGPQSAASDPALYPDGLHLSDLAHDHVAGLAAAGINAIL